MPNMNIKVAEKGLLSSIGLAVPNPVVPSK
jgi:hypothetical protein